jgi:hypothetical protein
VLDAVTLPRAQVTGNVGQCSIPSTATSVSINVVAVRATAPSHLSLFPYDPIPPSTASLNVGPGQGPAFNTVDVKIGPGGKIGVYHLAGSVHAIGDVVSYSTDVGLNDMQGEIDALDQAGDLLETQMDRQDRNHVCSAAVDSDGDKSSAGDFTSSRFATGGYSIVFDISSFEIPRTVGLSSIEPIAVVSTSCIGRNVTGTVVSATGTTTFDDVLVDVRVTDLNGAANNCPIAVQMVFSDPTPLSIGTL